MTTNATLDTSGMSCPMPVLKTKAAMEKLPVGQILELVSTDVGARTDIPAWCRRTGQELVETSESPDGKLLFFIRKAK